MKNNRKMRIAVITANVGGFDEQPDMKTQNHACDFYCYRRENLPNEISHLSNRMMSKYPKMQAHKLLPDYDVYVWLDARVMVRSADWVSWYLSQLQRCDIVTTTHPDRQNIAMEYDFMVKKIIAGDGYLTSRYTLSDLREQLWTLMTSGFSITKFPLFSAGISARWNSAKNNAMMDEWWEMSQMCGEYDQGFYSFLIWKHQLTYKTISFHNSYFKVLSH